MGRQDTAVEQLERLGFRIAQRTSALVFLVHPDYPGLLVRVGTVFVVAECDGHEIVRQRVDAFEGEAFVSAVERAKASTRR